MTLDLRAAAAAMNADGNPSPTPVAGWSVDTRTQNPGDVYFALRGPNFDGHDFVPAAIERNAAAVVVERRMGTDRELVVSDTLTALQDLGRSARTQWGGQVVGVTGSAGKTTTKDAIAHLLSAELPVGRTMGNLNNHVGVPLSILRLPDDSRAAALEMGMNHAGEIRDLARIAKPNVGVVTNVGYAHVEFFQDGIEGVTRAKRELIEELPPDGVAVLNGDDPRVARFREFHPGRTITFGFSEEVDVCGADLQVCAGPRGPATHFRTLGVSFETPLQGRHAILNLLAAIAVAQVFNIPPNRLRDSVRTFTVGKMRGERLEHNGILIWNDCYNSNPEAAQAMIDVLRSTPARHRIAVLGEMLELGHAGEELHRNLGRYAVDHGVDVLIGVRGQARPMVDAASSIGGEAKFFDDPADAGEFARTVAQSGDAVLFKGSRGVRVERALERFLA